MYFGHIHPQPLLLILPRLLTLDKLGALFFSSNNPLTPMFAAPILLHVGPSAGGCSISQKPHTPWKKTYSPSPRSHQPFRAPQLVRTDKGLWTSFSWKNVSGLSWAGILRSTTAVVEFASAKVMSRHWFPQRLILQFFYPLTSIATWILGKGSHLCLRNPQRTLYTFITCVFLSQSLSTTQRNFSDSLREHH